MEKNVRRCVWCGFLIPDKKGEFCSDFCEAIVAILKEEGITFDDQVAVYYYVVKDPPPQD